MNSGEVILYWAFFNYGELYMADTNILKARTL